MAWYFFTPLSACDPHIGKMVLGKPLDRFGETVICATLPFDTWCTRYDKLKLSIEKNERKKSAVINDCGVIADVEPYGLFSALIPASATSNGGDLQHPRDRQGLVPDFSITFPAQHGPSRNSQLVPA